MNTTTQLLQVCFSEILGPVADVKLLICLDVLEVRFVAQCNTFVIWLNLLGVGDGCLSEVFVLIYYIHNLKLFSGLLMLIDQYLSMHGTG